MLLIVAGVCGSIGQAIAGYSRTGCLGAIALGFIGALLGMWIARALSLPEVLSINIGGEASFPIRLVDRWRGVIRRRAGAAAL